LNSRAAAILPAAYLSYFKLLMVGGTGLEPVTPAM